jgi:hypothetical protein
MMATKIGSVLLLNSFCIDSDNNSNDILMADSSDAWKTLLMTEPIICDLDFLLPQNSLLSLPQYRLQPCESSNEKDVLVLFETVRDADLVQISECRIKNMTLPLLETTIVWNQATADDPASIEIVLDATDAKQFFQASQEVLQEQSVRDNAAFNKEHVPPLSFGFCEPQKQSMNEILLRMQVLKQNELDDLSLVLMVFGTLALLLAVAFVWNWLHITSETVKAVKKSSTISSPSSIDKKQQSQQSRSPASVSPNQTPPSVSPNRTFSISPLAFVDTASLSPCSKLQAQWTARCKTKTKSNSKTSRVTTPLRRTLLHTLNKGPALVSPEETDFALDYWG